MSAAMKLSVAEGTAVQRVTSASQALIGVTSASQAIRAYLVKPITEASLAEKPIDRGWLRHLIKVAFPSGGLEPSVQSSREDWLTTLSESTIDTATNYSFLSTMYNSSYCRPEELFTIPVCLYGLGQVAIDWSMSEDEDPDDDRDPYARRTFDVMKAMLPHRMSAYRLTDGKFNARLNPFWNGTTTNNGRPRPRDGYFAGVLEKLDAVLDDLREKTGCESEEITAMVLHPGAVPAFNYLETFDQMMIYRELPGRKSTEFRLVRSFYEKHSTRFGFSVPNLQARPCIKDCLYGLGQVAIDWSMSEDEDPDDDRDPYARRTFDVMKVMLPHRTREGLRGAVKGHWQAVLEAYRMIERDVEEHGPNLFGTDLTEDELAQLALVTERGLEEEQV